MQFGECTVDAFANECWFFKEALQFRDWVDVLRVNFCAALPDCELDECVQCFVEEAQFLVFLSRFQVLPVGSFDDESNFVRENRKDLIQ